MQKAVFTNIRYETGMVTSVNTLVEAILVSYPGGASIIYVQSIANIPFSKCMHLFNCYLTNYIHFIISVLIRKHGC